MNKKHSRWISKTKYYLNDPVFSHVDLNTNKKILLSPGKWVILLYPFEKMDPNIPFSWFYPFGDPVKFYQGIQYVLTYNLHDDIYFHHTIAQMVNIYQESWILDLDVPYYTWADLMLFSPFRRYMRHIIQYRDLFPPFTVNSNTNIYYKYEDENKRRTPYDEKI